MGYHLLVVLLSPLLLSLLAMATGALWPRRLVVWLTLLPAWVLAAFNVRLLTFAEELSGPVQVLGRLDLLGILLSSFAMPVSAGLVWMNRFSEPCRALRASPWRYGSFQASMSGLGILPLPIPLWSMWALRAWQWRWPHTPYLLAGGAMLAPDLALARRRGSCQRIDRRNRGVHAAAALAGSSVRRGLRRAVVGLVGLAVCRVLGLRSVPPGRSQKFSGYDPEELFDWRQLQSGGLSR